MTGKEIKGILNKRQFHYNSPLLYMAAEINGFEFPRMAIICKKGIGGAVKRNRTKRILSQLISNNYCNIAKNMNIIAIPKKGNCRSKEFQSEIEKARQKWAK
ncbi:MAG: ribonuclease P protein component [Candidatus Margulisbacteria bacterium]|nr:ribonuclease P protein component [Candidatus Margulisiibacteriota bacterium]